MLRRALIKDSTEIVSLISASLLGELYFKNRVFSDVIEKAINRKEIMITLDHDEITALLWFELNATFRKYPYLHMLLVKESYQGQGIGRMLIKHFEEELTAEYDKVFLMVADQNKKAQAIYIKSGYKQVGILQDFYKEGVTEILMSKDK